MSRGFDDAATTAAAPRSSVTTVELVSAHVEVVGGRDAGLAAPVDVSGIWIGTGPQCDLILADDFVSRRHLEVRPETGGVRLLDRASRTGTFLGTTRIHEALLTVRTAVRLGETTLLVRVSSGHLAVEISPRTELGEAVAQSLPMRHVFSVLERAARSDATVLLEGDTGTGKQFLARAVHAESARRDGPFVVVDCGAISDIPIDSELFGHEQGAFAGAVAMRPGALEQADGGTIFLANIGELPLDAQPKLLRALESRAFERVGGSESVSVDVRVVAATNRRLRASVRRQEFHEELFHHLAVVNVTVPRLAERPEDVAPLAESFLRIASGDPSAVLPPELARVLPSYDWPGNVRELRNVIESFVTYGKVGASRT